MVILRSQVAFDTGTYYLVRGEGYPSPKDNVRSQVLLWFFEGSLGPTPSNWGWPEEEVLSYLWRGDKKLEILFGSRSGPDE